MIEIALASVLSTSSAHAIQKSENVNKFCAYLVGIPYASDNFTDSEWERFQVCRELIDEK